MSNNLSERLQDPLGPFNVVDLLLPRKGLRKSLVLDTVVLKQRNEFVGFDILDNGRERDRGPIYFMGVLKLTDGNRACLTREGSRRLRQELSRRFGRLGEQHFDRTGFTLKVKVCGELFAEPIGLNSSDDFTIVARDTPTMIEHEFVVQSLHVSTSPLSRNYILKWKLLRQIISIAKQHERTPIGSRTPRWLVSKYLESNSQHFQVHRENPVLAARNVHRAEVYNTLARHCRWLEQKISKTRTLLDRSSWREFVLLVEERVRKTQKRNADDCDDVDQRWPEEDELEAEDQPPQADDMEAEPEYHEPDFQHTYRQVGVGQASDIASGQILAENEEMKLYTRADVLAAVPNALISQEPEFPTSSVWRCPVDSCDYVVVLRNVHRMNFEWMDNDDKNFLRSGLWGPTNDRAIELFNDIVEEHFYQHLKMAGIRHVARLFVGRDALNNPRYQFIELDGPRQVKPEYDQFKFEWINPRHH